MTWLQLPTDISTFLDNASSITSFCLHGYYVLEPATQDQGTIDLVAALQRNANINSLELRRLDDLYVIPILEGLRLNTSVKTFIFGSWNNVSGEASHAIQHLLESSTSY